MPGILLTAAGSYGDVAPYTGVGARLREAGHEVTLATHDSYAPLVRAAGLEFRRLPADPRRPDTTGPARHTGPRTLLRTAAAFLRELGDGLADAARPGTDLLLFSTTAPLGHHLAEGLRLPSLGVATAPIPFRGLSPDHGAARLADALTRATAAPARRDRATASARRLAAEDGAGAVVEAVGRLSA